MASYRLSGAMANLVGIASILAGAAGPLLLLRSPLPAYAVSLLLTMTPWLLTIVYEAVAYRSSHNLFPIEVAIFAITSLIIHSPSVLIRFVLHSGLQRSRHQNRSTSEVSERLEGELSP